MCCQAAVIAIFIAVIMVIITAVTIIKTNFEITTFDQAATFIIMKGIGLNRGCFSRSFTLSIVLKDFT